MIEQNRGDLWKTTFTRDFSLLRKSGFCDSVLALLPLHDGGHDERREEGGEHLRHAVANPRRPRVALGYLLHLRWFKIGHTKSIKIWLRARLRGHKLDHTTCDILREFIC